MKVGVKGREMQLVRWMMVGLAGAPLVACGCSSSEQDPLAAIEPVTRGDPGAAQAPIAAIDILPMDQAGSGWSRVFTETLEDGTEAHAMFALDRRDDGVWLGERRDDELVRERLLVPGGDGSWVTPIMRNTSRGRITVFEPPIVYLPPALEPGGRVEQVVQMSVRSADRPDRVQQSGTGTLTIESAGEQQVVIAGEPRRVNVVRSMFRADLGVARIDRQAEWSIDAGDRLVGIREEEEIRVLGFVRERNRTTLVWRGEPDAR